MVGGGGAPATAYGAATLLGLRNAVYGVQIGTLLRPRGWRRLVTAQLTIDESTATALAQDDPDEQRRGFWAAGLGVYVLWNLFTAVGAIGGDALGDPRRWGLDAAATAAFLALLWPKLVDRDAVSNRAVAAVCALVTVVAVPVLPAGVPILLAAVVAAAMGWRRSAPR